VPPALGSGLVLGPCLVLASEAVARLQLVDPCSEPLVSWLRWSQASVAASTAGCDVVAQEVSQTWK